jgi:outer membrane protein
MRKIMKRNILLLFMLAGACLLSALTLEEAKQTALERNSRYLAQKNAYSSARWSKQQSLSALMPSLTLSGTYAYLDPATVITGGGNNITLNHDSRSAALTLSQPLFMGGKLWQAYRISSISSEMAKLSLESTRLSILAETESKYMNVLQLQDLLEISQKDWNNSKNNQDIGEIRYNTGSISQADFLKLKSRAASKEVAYIQASVALDLAKQDLANLLDLPELDELEPVDYTAELPLMNLLGEVNPQQADFIDRAEQISRANNPGLQTAAASVNLSKKSYNIARGTFLPTLMLSASRSYKENGLDRYEFEGTNTLALTASVPLLPFWNNYSASRKAYYDLQKSRQDYKTAEDGILLSVKAAVLNLLSGARQVKAAELALQYAEQTYLQMEERFRNNLVSVTDMTDAEVVLQSARVSRANSYYSFLKAKTTLKQVLGTDDDAVITSILQATEEK